MEIAIGPRKDGRWYDHFPVGDKLTEEEKQRVLRENEARGTLHLIEYRNAMS